MIGGERLKDGRIKINTNSVMALQAICSATGEHVSQPITSTLSVCLSELRRFLGDPGRVLSTRAESLRMFRDLFSKQNPYIWVIGEQGP